MGKTKGSRGHWADHKYRRRSVKPDEDSTIKDFVIKTFCGWSTLERYINQPKEVIHKALRAIAFCTGGRATEVLSLQDSQFSFEVKRMTDITQNGEVISHPVKFIIVSGMPVLKQSTLVFRSFPIRQDEPATKWMLAWLAIRRQQLEEGKGIKWSDGSERLFPFGYDWMYKWITKDAPNWWPHRLRAERASQLAIEYNYSVPRLMTWFKWESSDMPTHYASMNVSDLVAGMSKGLI